MFTSIKHRHTHNQHMPIKNAAQQIFTTQTTHTLTKVVVIPSANDATTNIIHIKILFQPQSTTTKLKFSWPEVITTLSHVPTFEIITLIIHALKIKINQTQHPPLTHTYKDTQINSHQHTQTYCIDTYVRTYGRTAGHPHITIYKYTYQHYNLYKIMYLAKKKAENRSQERHEFTIQSTSVKMIVFARKESVVFKQKQKTIQIFSPLFYVLKATERIQKVSTKSRKNT
eukprot:TRINITY_DN6891_c0_g2_i5.p2 TRINITY_DN6891_c0_g2~~TRINITY_DN6891_c0_g2_i5.p2  ORF type:complete len:246 (+),score=-13.78 TRINITY_DN6891_c0_g2_i5:55-738(+)